MSFFTSLVSAFKGGGGSRVPVARGFISPWASGFDGGPLQRAPFDYAREVAEAYLANPVAQRSVRIVAEGVGGAPLACADAPLAKLLACRCRTCWVGAMKPVRASCHPCLQVSLNT